MVEFHQHKAEKDRGLGDDQRDFKRGGKPPLRDFADEKPGCPCQDNRIDNHGAKLRENRNPIFNPHIFDVDIQQVGLDMAVFKAAVGSAHKIQPEGKQHDDLIRAVKVTLEAIPLDNRVNHTASRTDAGNNHQPLDQLMQDCPKPCFCQVKWLFGHSPLLLPIPARACVQAFFPPLARTAQNTACLHVPACRQARGS